MIICLTLLLFDDLSQFSLFLFLLLLLTKNVSNNGDEYLLNSSEQILVNVSYSKNL